jgi:ketosteroid isomerase-like protein
VIRRIEAALITIIIGCVACSRASPGSPVDGNAAAAGIDSLNDRLIQTYRDRNPTAYGALYTDTAVFEWPAFNTVRGRSGLEAMVRSNWANLDSMDLKLAVASRRIAKDQATEFGAFEQSYREKGVHKTEFGRYVTVLARQPDGTWRIDRFFGFEDSTRLLPSKSR